MRRIATHRRKEPAVCSNATTIPIAVPRGLRWVRASPVRFPRTRLGQMPRPHTRPPAELIAWVEQTLGSSARVVGWKRLTGGLTSVVHELTVERNGPRERY